MTIYKNYKDAGDNLTGKILISKNNQHVSNGKNLITIPTGAVYFIMMHSKNDVIDGNYTSHRGDTLRVIHDGASCQIAVNTWFGENWAIAEPVDLFKGEGVCFTGALSLTREYYEKIVQLFGGDFQSSVTKKTKYLVMADKHSQSSKAVKARAQGVTLINEQEFLNLIRNHD